MISRAGFTFFIFGGKTYARDAAHQSDYVRRRRGSLCALLLVMVARFPARRAAESGANKVSLD